VLDVGLGKQLSIVGPGSRFGVGGPSTLKLPSTMLSTAVPPSRPRGLSSAAASAARADSDDEDEERKEHLHHPFDHSHANPNAAELLYASTPSGQTHQQLLQTRGIGDLPELGLSSGGGGWDADSAGLLSDEGDGGSTGGGVGSHGGGAPVVLVSAAGASCCICTTSDFVDPWISDCAHICCSECWITWLQENVDHKCCPECDTPLRLEDLRPIALCPICSAIPTQPWTAPCHHTACRDCWAVWLAENPVCSECNQPVDKDKLPPPNGA
jgi:hypothetical protein